MINTYRIIPTYTGDVSGIASALYEYKGMVVIHDPSGCNSTYNTHDETRWYDLESLIYISGLTESDAIFGNDEKFIDDIVYAANEMKPSFIALVSSPIPYINGTDFEGIARIIEKKTSLPCFFVESNGMHDYSVGAGRAFEELGRKFLPLFSEEEKKLLISNKRDELSKQDSRIKINLLGLTPLDFDGDDIVSDLMECFKDYEINSVWGMGSSLESIAKSFQAHVNIVISITGKRIAKLLKEMYGIPYVCGLPVMGDISYLESEINKKLGKNYSEYTVPPVEKAEVFLIGEPVLMASYARVLNSCNANAIAVNPLEEDLDLECIRTAGEEDLEKLIRNAKEVYGDPLYKPIVPQTCIFHPMSHEAFSGRCFRKERANLFRR